MHAIEMTAGADWRLDYHRNVRKPPLICQKRPPSTCIPSGEAYDIADKSQLGKLPYANLSKVFESAVEAVIERNKNYGAVSPAS